MKVERTQVRERGMEGEHDKRKGVWFSTVDKGGWLIVYYHCSERYLGDKCYIILSLFT